MNKPVPRNPPCMRLHWPSCSSRSCSEVLRAMRNFSDRPSLIPILCKLSHATANPLCSACKNQMWLDDLFLPGKFTEFSRSSISIKRKKRFFRSVISRPHLSELVRDCNARIDNGCQLWIQPWESLPHEDFGSGWPSRA